MNKVLSVLAITLILSAGNSPVQQIETTYATVQVGPAKVEIQRTGQRVSMQIDGVPKEGEITVSRSDSVILESSDGVVEDLLPAYDLQNTYTFSLERPVQPSSNLVLQGEIDDQLIDNYVHLDVVKTQIPSASGNSDSAYAVVALPTRTRFRYQTFIEEYDTPAPPVVCSPISTGDYLLVSNFLGNNRTWNADSNSFKTRSDVVIDWSAGGTLTPEFSVGETTLVLDYSFLLSHTNERYIMKRTAGAESMKLIRGAMSADFVSFQIESDVTNPFCSGLVTNGIYYDFSFYVHREGTFVAHGTLLRVPNHELYSRNNVNSNWRTILQVSNQGFQCLIKLSFGCTTDPYIRGDLMP